MNNNTIDVNQQIISLREDGLMQKEIANELSITRDKVRYVLNKAGMTNYERSKECLNCGESFRSVGHHARFCSGRCRSKHHKQTTLKKRECKRCGKKFKSYKSLYCSGECRRKPEKHKVEYIPKPKHKEICMNCNQEYETHKTTSKYCSYDCSYEYKVKQKPVHSLRCKECSKHFSSTNKRKLYCSTDCNNKFFNRKKETLRRERIKRNGKVDWGISIERLMKRDRGICYLCDESVNINLDSNQDYYPSIEHVKPIAKGGTHTWDNVKLAHRKCNYEKSDKII